MPAERLPEDLLRRLTPAAEALRRATAAALALSAPARPGRLPPDREALLRAAGAALAALERSAEGLPVRQQLLLVALASRLA